MHAEADMSTDAREEQPTPCTQNGEANAKVEGPMASTSKFYYYP